MSQATFMYICNKLRPTIEKQVGMGLRQSYPADVLSADIIFHLKHLQK